MEKYEKIRVIGRGAYGTAHLCRRLSDQKLVVMKQIPVDQLTKEEKELSLVEAKVLSMLDHPNIVACYENILAENSILIVMEYAAGGTLFEFLQQRDSQLLPEEEVLHYFVQMVLALHHVHSRQILHRDLKTTNILLNDRKDLIKVGDFGISKILVSKSKACTVVGTPCYIAPELCEGKSYNQKSDIWSLGCILYELLSLKRPFEADTWPKLFLKITKGSFEPVEGHYSSDIQQMLLSMLQKDPSKRPSIPQIMAQPFTISYVYGVYLRTEALPCLVSRKNLEPCTSSSPVSALSIHSSSVDTAITSGKMMRLQKLGSPDPKHQMYVYLWDQDFDSPATLPLPDKKTEVKMVAMGNRQKVMVTNVGSALTWKDDPEFGFAIHYCFSEEKFGKTITQVACGKDFTAFLTGRGILMTSGSGKSGALGHGDLFDVTRPKIVESLLRMDIVSVACGTEHVMVLTREHEVYAWGQGGCGRLGLGSNESHHLPRKVSLSADCRPKKIYCGSDVSFLVCDDSRLLVCGSNRHNKLALDTEDGLTAEEARTFTSAQADPLPNIKVKEVASGPVHTAILAEDGSLYTVGSNVRGQLGWGETGLTHNIPGRVETHESRTFVQAACGNAFTIAISHNGEVYKWGCCKDSPEGKGQRLRLPLRRSVATYLDAFGKSAITVVKVHPK